MVGYDFSSADGSLLGCRLASMSGYDKRAEDMAADAQRREIDMVTSARKTPDREEKFDFSRPIERIGF